MEDKIEAELLRSEICQLDELIDKKTEVRPMLSAAPNNSQLTALEEYKTTELSRTASAPMATFGLRQERSATQPSKRNFNDWKQQIYGDGPTEIPASPPEEAPSTEDGGSSDLVHDLNARLLEKQLELAKTAQPGERARLMAEIRDLDELIECVN